MVSELPPEVHAQIEAEIRDLKVVKPHMPTATVMVAVDGERIAVLMLSLQKTNHCSAYSEMWQKKGMTFLEKDDRRDFLTGLLVEARKDVNLYLCDLTTSGPDEFEGRDVTEAAALQIVILILGNMVMHAIHLRHIEEQKRAQLDKADTGRPVLPQQIHGQGSGKPTEVVQPKG